MLGRIVIAIDGYSACGKSTTAKEVAKILGYRYIDSGAMYRAVTLYFIDHHIALTNQKEVTAALDAIRITFQVNSKGVSETFLNGLNVEDRIRDMSVSSQVSQVSALREVRLAMVSQQRKLGKHKGIVMDGRDIGSVVFPDAELKLFLTANLEIRAFRRQRELLAKGELVEIDKILENLVERDRIDSTRKESPLIRAEGSIEIDTSFVTIDEQVDEVVRLALGEVTKTSLTLR